MSAPEPMVPNQPAKLQFTLGDKYHTFLKRHRVMVQIQSSWFPMFDRNPQTFVDIYHANLRTIVRPSTESSGRRPCRRSSRCRCSRPADEHRMTSQQIRSICSWDLGEFCGLCVQRRKCDPCVIL